MDELIEQFAIEARELVQQASDDLICLGGDPANRERMESAFRAIHTLKGSVGLFDFGPMLEVLHQAEDLLSEARDGNIPVDATLIDPILAVIEWVEDSIDGIAQTGHLSEAQDKQAARLLTLMKSEMISRETTSLIFPSSVPDWAVSLHHQYSAGGADEALIALRYEPHPECFFNGDDPLATVSRLPGLRHLSLHLKQPSPSLESYDPFRCYLVIEAVCGGEPSDVVNAFRLIPDQATVVRIPAEADLRKPAAAVFSSRPEVNRQTSMLRVDSGRIDKLIEIAGELITAKNALIPLAEEARNEGNSSLSRRIRASHMEIEQLVASLYNAATRARMVPLEQTFRRFPRLVRETSAKLGKSLDLIMEGETIEADREIVENLFEPLLHIIRNCLDHGLEPEAERLGLSKPARGRIFLRARRHGDQIGIEIADDGRGIDPERIRKTAIERGIVAAAQANALADQDVLQFVFAAGFSTVSSISDLSGRGVGLDVVQSSIQRLGGTVELRSTVGSGTSFSLNLPISFSMAQVMVVEAGGERYGLPIADVLETCKLPTSTVQSIRAGRAFVLRNRTIPLFYLAELLQIPIPSPHSTDIKVLIVRAGTDQIGIAVDTIAERAETLTRPLNGLLRGIPGIAGTTLLGDGRVLLVLNLEELLQ
jgi:two-component system, chemotaxis family, sensor kinase CheA